MGGVVADWSSDRIEGFEKAIVRFRHTLAERPLFSDAGLIGVLNRYPRDAMGIFTMGEDLEDWQSWRRGTANGLDGAALLEAVRQGRLWLNLRHANKHLPEFAALCDEISAEKEKHLKTRILNRDLGLLISSPNARVFYHLDVPLSSLWQVRGVKRIWFYPRGEPFTDPAWLERCVHGVAEGQMPFLTEWDGQAETFELTAGDMVTWPQNMPHRVRQRPDDECLGLDGVHDPAGADPRQRAARQRRAAYDAGLDAGNPGSPGPGHGRQAGGGQRAQGLDQPPQGPAGAAGDLRGRDPHRMTAEISIIIPTQRRLEGLARAARSVFAQGGVDAASLELVVVDNDQTPSAQAAAEALAAEAPFPVRYVHEPRARRRQCPQRRA